MYVCICNALTDRRIHGAIEAGAGSLCAVYRSCGVAPQCGKCGAMIRSLLPANRTDGCPTVGAPEARQAAG